MIKNVFAITLLLLAFNLTAQTFDNAKMDSFFAKIGANDKGMGSISIFKKGHEVYQNAFGFSDVENKFPASAITKYRIGSISKTFTATIIMQLVEEKKLSLNTKLAEFYPEIPNAKEITIEQLLRHRSGLYNFTNSKEYVNWMEEPHTQQDLLNRVMENEPVFEPNEKAEYSNTNYVLLSFIAEKLEDKYFSTILEDRISTPCQLSNTYYGDKINPLKNEALSYTRLQNWELATETDMSVPLGAGAVVSNPTDLNSFYTQLFTGTLISDKSLSEMKKIVDGFGIGMFQLPFYEKKAFGHTGGIDGFQSMAAYFPEDSIAIAYTTNGVVMPMNDIMIGALSIYFGNEYTLPEFKPTLELKSEELDQYLGVYSSPSLPIDITITKEGNVLMGQGTGQPKFPLEAYELHQFKFDQAMLKMEFLPKENKMILRQGGGEFEFSKKE
ncbi:MAG: D-Ala-D-Ala carboxypeptidase [Saprospiraceae bacterium]|nr:MAG: D-Ala-D-Ala carboxypeptidase [Saprospiraceae bacterium]